MGGFVLSSAGVTLTDLGNVFHDLTGSYGVNVFGNDFYKECMAQGAAQVRDLGPVLGSYHPVMLYNVKRLREISGLDEISFHMSSTEAVMQAVRLAQYHTERKYLVRFSGAYHGWWGDVQPGIGNPIAAPYTYILREMDAATLRVLNSRRDIACVLINPLQALHRCKPCTPTSRHAAIPRCSMAAAKRGSIKRLTLNGCKNTLGYAPTWSPMAKPKRKVFRLV